MTPQPNLKLLELEMKGKSKRCRYGASEGVSHLGERGAKWIRSIFSGI
jgi:hypothetical protein